MTEWVLIGVALAALVGGSVVWRWLSRRYQLPCPAWLAWGLENPLMVWAMRTRVTLERIRLRAGQRIVEIGPGPGRLLLPAARIVGPTGEALGVDVQPRMIELLEENAERAGITNLSGLVADAATVELPREHFDIAFVALALGEIPKREEALARCYECLKLGGWLSITEYFPDPHFVRRATVRRLAEAAGFEHIETRGNALQFTANFVKRPAPSGAVRGSVDEAFEDKPIEHRSGASSPGGE